MRNRFSLKLTFSRLQHIKLHSLVFEILGVQYLTYTSTCKFLDRFYFKGKQLLRGKIDRGFQSQTGKCRHFKKIKFVILMKTKHFRKFAKLCQGRLYNPRIIPGKLFFIRLQSNVDIIGGSQSVEGKI